MSRNTTCAYEHTPYVDIQYAQEMAGTRSECRFTISIDARIDEPAIELAEGINGSVDGPLYCIVVSDVAGAATDGGACPHHGINPGLGGAQSPDACSFATEVTSNGAAESTGGAGDEVRAACVTG